MSRDSKPTPDKAAPISAEAGKRRRFLQAGAGLLAAVPPPTPRGARSEEIL